MNMTTILFCGLVFVTTKEGDTVGGDIVLRSLQRINIFLDNITFLVIGLIYSIKLYTKAEVNIQTKKETNYVLDHSIQYPVDS